MIAAFAVYRFKSLGIFLFFLSFTTSLFADSHINPELRALNGKIIRTIIVQIRDIFDGDDISSAYRMVNSLKKNTQEKVIRRELLFKEGGSFDAFRLKESERILRGQRYLRNVSITPRADGDFVDLLVAVQDTWTLIPKVSYSSGSGRNRRFIGLADSNVAGYGKRFEVGADETDRRKALQTVWEDPRILGTPNRVVGAFIQRSDGDRGFFTMDRPFRSYLDPWGWSVDGNVGNIIGRLFDNGSESFIYRQKIFDVTALYTFAETTDPEKRVSRYSFGYHVENYRFSNASLKDYADLDLNPADLSKDPNLLASDRRFSGPQIGYRHLEPDFISMNYIDKFDRTEDYNLGHDFFANATLAPTFLGSSDDAMLFSGNYSKGWRLPGKSFIRSEAGVSSRIMDNGLKNSLFRTESRYYDALEPTYLKGIFVGRHTLAANFRLDYGWQIDKDRQFLLGGDNGLRGYKARDLTGDKKILLNLEDRVHLAEDILKLVSVGAVAFIDGGAVSYDSFGDMLGNQMYGDTGVGLRIVFPRSSGAQVLRMDIAWPFREGPDGNRAWQLRILFATDQIFGSRLSSEAVGSEAANVEVGFDR